MLKAVCSFSHFISTSDFYINIIICINTRFILPLPFSLSKYIVSLQSDVLRICTYLNYHYIVLSCFIFKGGPTVHYSGWSKGSWEGGATVQHRHSDSECYRQKQPSTWNHWKTSKETCFSCNHLLFESFLMCLLYFQSVHLITDTNSLVKKKFKLKYVSISCLAGFCGGERG